MGEVIHVNFNKELNDSQRNHWWHQLESAERAVEVAKRVLGILQIEQGLDGTDKFDVFPDDVA